jgi:hypothetical protein
VAGTGISSLNKTTTGLECARGRSIHIWKPNGQQAHSYGAKPHLGYQQQREAWL